MFVRILAVLYALILWFAVSAFMVFDVTHVQGRTPDAWDWVMGVMIGLASATMLFLLSLLILVLIPCCWNWLKTGKFR